MSRNSRFPFCKRRSNQWHAAHRWHVYQHSEKYLPFLLYYYAPLETKFDSFCYNDFREKNDYVWQGTVMQTCSAFLVFASGYWACCCSYEANAAKSWCSAVKIYNSAGLLFIMWLLCPAALVIWCILSIRSLVTDW